MGYNIPEDHHSSGGTLSRLDALNQAATEAVSEARLAMSQWPPFNSLHEGWGVLSEEMDELWEHVRMNQKRRDPAMARKEALQVAAMALRIAVDCCTEEGIRK